MKIVINPNDPSPKYCQLMAQIQRHIVSGALMPGVKLTSVRKLASELAINPMTISRCYQLMEQQGWLERKNGIGMMVARDGLPARMEDRFSYISATLNAFIIDARSIGYSKSEVMLLVMRCWEENDETKS